MVEDYWTLFYLTLIGAIVLISFFVLGFVFMKKLFLNKKYGIIKLIACSCVTLFSSALCVSNFSKCCKDYEYVAHNTYIQEKAKVVEFTESYIDYDGNGRRVNSKPRFYLIDKDEYIVLYTKDVEIGEIYIIRFYPNTKICDIIEKIS